jgi:YjbE family integral membrane protein
MEPFSPEFWSALGQIIVINLILSGDNAVVIALAARSLPPKQQKQAIMFGSGAAIVMRVVLTIVAVQLLQLPYLKIIGAALLLWIGVKLLVPEGDEEGGEADAKASGGMASAIKTILIADLVMSLDNVIAVAAAAKDSTLLLIIGLALSIPLVIFGSTLLLKLMERWPIIITIGAMLLGKVAGEMAVTDPMWGKTIELAGNHWVWIAEAVGALFVLVIGKYLAARQAHQPAAALVDLAQSEQGESK